MTDDKTAMKPGEHQGSEEQKLSDLPDELKLNWKTLINAEEGTDADIIDALDKYFEPFAQPPMEGNKIIDGHCCLKCKKPQTGMLSGNFTWGLAHGEGYCRNCGWPARAHHYIKDANGEEFMTITNFILQYHPDFVKKGESP